jgi:hypothetical protein
MPMCDQQRDMHLLGIRRRARVQRDADLGGELTELGEDVLPLPDPQIVQVLRLAHPAELVAGQLLLLLFEVRPQVEEAEEVRRRIAEPGVRLLSLRLVVGGSFARVLDRQRRGDDHHLADAAVAVGLDDHPRQPGVDRELGELPPGPRQALPVVERAELGE